MQISSTQIPTVCSSAEIRRSSPVSSEFENPSLVISESPRELAEANPSLARIEPQDPPRAQPYAVASSLHHSAGFRLAEIYFSVSARKLRVVEDLPHLDSRI